MAAKLTRLIYQIAIRRTVASESCRLITSTFCCRFWRWVLNFWVRLRVTALKKTRCVTYEFWVRWNSGLEVFTAVYDVV